MRDETLLDITAPILKVLSAKIAKTWGRRAEPTEEDIKTVCRLLSGRLVYLLRYMDTHPDPIYPHAFGRVLSSFVEVENTRQPACHSVEGEREWEKASQYAAGICQCLVS